VCTGKIKEEDRKDIIQNNGEVLNKLDKNGK